MAERRRLTFTTSLPHYVDHLAPIWKALDVEAEWWTRSRPIAAYCEARGIPAQFGNTPRAERIWVVASHVDLRMRRPPVVFVEHGAGQTYVDGGAAGNGGWAGGIGRDNVALFLCPSEKTAALNSGAYPNARSVCVGSPRLDELCSLERQRGPTTVAFSFHYDCKLTDETRWAFPHFHEIIANLARRSRSFEILGHAHPRSAHTLGNWWRGIGVEFTDDFAEVCRRADLYVCDNSSTIFEFAALGRPVVLLNAPGYRRDVEHGLRFWSESDVGINVDDPNELPYAIKRALRDPSYVARRRAAAVDRVYDRLDGHAAQRAAREIRRLL